MNLKELKSQVDFLVDNCMMSHQDPSQVTVGIMVETVGSVGGTPTVPLKGIHLGFDWDRGRALVQPETMLREIGRDEITAMRKAHDELSWSWYKINKIKRENEALKQKIKDLT
jgi:hypothetical protein